MTVIGNVGTLLKLLVVVMHVSASQCCYKRLVYHGQFPLVYIDDCTSNYDLGLLVGSTFSSMIKGRLRESAAFQKVQAYCATNWGRELLSALKDLHREAYPPYFAELQGIAAGSGVPFDQIFMLNLRQEILAASDSPDMVQQWLQAHPAVAQAATIASASAVDAAGSSADTRRSNRSGARRSGRTGMRGRGSGNRRVAISAPSAADGASDEVASGTIRRSGQREGMAGSVHGGAALAVGGGRSDGSISQDTQRGPPAPGGSTAPRTGDVAWAGRDQEVGTGMDAVAAGGSSKGLGAGDRTQPADRSPGTKVPGGEGGGGGGPYGEGGGGAGPGAGSGEWVDPLRVDACSDAAVRLVAGAPDPAAEPSVLLVGHNEDMTNDTLGRMYYIRASMPGRSSWFALTYAGELASTAFGANTAGVAFTLNALYPTEALLPGLGRNFLSRRLLDARSTDEAMDVLAETDQATGRSVNLMSTRPPLAVWNVEIGPGGSYDILELSDNDWYFHANSYVRLPQRQKTDNSSIHRQARAAQYSMPTTPPEVLALLGDTDDAEFPIYRTGDYGGLVYTLCTALYDLPARTLTVYRGNPRLGIVGSVLSLDSLMPRGTTEDRGSFAGAVELH